MKHNFLVLFAGCGVLAAVGFAGSHGQSGGAVVRAGSVRAQAPVAVVIAPDGSRSVATCVASPCVASTCVTTTRAVSGPAVAVVCCDPVCDPKQGRAAASVVRVSTGGNGQVVACGSGNGVLSVGSGSGLSGCSAQAGGGVGSVSCSSGTATCSAGPVTGASCGQGSAACGSMGTGVTKVEPAHAGPLQGSGQLTLAGPMMSGNLAVGHDPVANGQTGLTAQSVDLGALVQGLRGSVGSLAVQGPATLDEDDAPHVFTFGDDGAFEMMEVPEVADVGDMSEGFGEDEDDAAWSNDLWKEEVEAALERARAQVDGAEDVTREVIENAQEEMARAQSGWASVDAQQAHKEAVEKAHAQMKSAMADAKRAQEEVYAQQRSGFHALAQAQDERAKEMKERRKSGVWVMQDGQRIRAGSDAEVRASKRASGGGGAQDGDGLEARVEALERMAKARGREVSGKGSLENRVAELERAMKGAGEARAPKAARVLEVPRGGVFTTTPRLELARPATPRAAPRAAPRVATPPVAPVAPTPSTPRMFVPKMRLDSLNKSQGMDADTRRDLERAMSDLRREAARLREEMSKLRSEIDRLPRDSGR